jgi:hypothetical protein
VAASFQLADFADKRQVENLPPRIITDWWQPHASVKIGSDNHEFPDCDSKKRSYYYSSPA